MREWLKKIRITAGLSQEQVALAAKVKRAYYTQIETGVRNPSVRTAKKIASRLNFDWVIFFEKRCIKTKPRITRVTHGKSHAARCGE